MSDVTQATVVGVYDVADVEGCHLIEVHLSGVDGPVDVAAFTQPWAGRGESDWQVPYQEALLDADGAVVLAGPWLTKADEPLWSGTVRLAFFFHYLDPTRALQSPFGPVDLPAPSRRPARLDQLRYEPPD